MPFRARTFVVAGICANLAVAAGCSDDAAKAREVGRTATTAQVEKFDPALARNLPPNVSERAAAQGHELFIVCATCHGPDARGTQLGPALRDQEWIHISGEYEEIQRVIREGVAEPEEFPVPMPPGGGGDLNDEQLRAVAAYVYALSRSGAATAAQ